MIDTHCHLNFDPMSSDVATTIRRAQEAGIDRFVVPGTSLETSCSAVDLSREFSSVFAAVGIHPQDAAGADIAAIENLLKEHPEIVAVGEVGLDYYRPEYDASDQAEVFHAMLGLARTYAKPVIIHTRAAHHETLQALKGLGDLTVLVHSFSGSLQEAQDLLDVGCWLGINGIVTFKKNWELREVVAKLPLERLVLETDAPFLSPEGFRGRPNEPARVKEVAECLATIKMTTADVIGAITAATAQALFNLPA